MLHQDRPKVAHRQDILLNTIPALNAHQGRITHSYPYKELLNIASYNNHHCFHTTDETSD